MELVDPFGWHKLDGATLTYIRERLALFETMTWSEVLVQAKNRAGGYWLSRPCILGPSERLPPCPAAISHL